MNTKRGKPVVRKNVNVFDNYKRLVKKFEESSKLKKGNYYKINPARSFVKVKAGADLIRDYEIKPKEFKKVLNTINEVAGLFAERDLTEEQKRRLNTAYKNFILTLEKEGRITPRNPNSRKEVRKIGDYLKEAREIQKQESGRVVHVVKKERSS